MEGKLREGFQGKGACDCLPAVELIQENAGSCADDIKTGFWPQTFPFPESVNPASDAKV